MCIHGRERWVEEGYIPSSPRKLYLHQGRPFGASSKSSVVKSENRDEDLLDPTMLFSYSVDVPQK